MSNDNYHLTIGILGAANIAKKNCRAVSHPSTSCKIAAIASRRKEKGDDFVAQVFPTTIPCDAPIVYGGDSSYSTLLENASCDAVYIPLPTKLHNEYVIRALESGKHVLLEKPVANSAKEYRQMLTAASQNGKLLMDGTMFVHHPRTKEFVTSIPNATRVHFTFTFDGDEAFHQNDIRTKKDGDFMGCIGDLGWYCTKMGLLVFSGADADNLKGLVTDVQVTRYKLNEEGVPLDAECMVYFTANRVLSFYCSFMHPLNQTVQISGHGCKYTAIETDAILPFNGEKINFNYVNQSINENNETVSTTKVVEFDNTLVQEVCMWRNFNEWARTIEQSSSTNSSSLSVDIENGKWWHGEGSVVKEANASASYSLCTQMVLDGLMKSVRSNGSMVKVML